MMKLNMWERSVSFLDESEIKAYILMVILSLTFLFGRLFSVSESGMSDTRKHCCFEIFLYKLILHVRGIKIFIKTSTEDVNKM